MKRLTMYVLVIERTIFLDHNSYSCLGLTNVSTVNRFFLFFFPFVKLVLYREKFFLLLSNPISTPTSHCTFRSEFVFKWNTCYKWAGKLWKKRRNFKHIGKTRKNFDFLRRNHIIFFSELVIVWLRNHFSAIVHNFFVRRFITAIHILHTLKQSYTKFKRDYWLQQERETSGNRTWIIVRISHRRKEGQWMFGLFDKAGILRGYNGGRVGRSIKKRYEWAK